MSRFSNQKVLSHGMRPDAAEAVEEIAPDYNSRGDLDPAASPATSRLVKETNVKPFLSVSELTALTPWTEDAIRTKVRRGSWKRGVHFFQPEGHGGQWVFFWPAIVMYIEGINLEDQNQAQTHGIDITAAAEAATRLLG